MSVPDDADAMFVGEQAYDALGIRVRGAGDLDSDGVDDLLVSAMGYPAETYQGAVFFWGGGAR